jgi:hypothetical protein
MNYKNFAYSLVATAPSPAGSGTSLVVTAGEGVKFPTVPFYATIWQAGVMPSTTNAEIVLVTLVSTDTFTITRQQESTSARTIVVGDQISATISAATAHTIKNQNLQVKTDSYLLTDADDLVVCNKTTAMTITLPVAVGRGKIFTIKNINTGAVTVDGDTDDTIDGETTQLVYEWESITIVDYVANKWIII